MIPRFSWLVDNGQNVHLLRILIFVTTIFTPCMSEDSFLMFYLVETLEMSDTVPVAAFGAPIQSFQQR